MRSVYILILLFVASWAYSHDDVAYRTSKDGLLISTMIHPLIKVCLEIFQKKK